MRTIMEKKKIWVKRILVLAIILILGAIPTPLSSCGGLNHIVQAQTVGIDTMNVSVGQETGMMIFLIGIVIIVLIVVIAAVIVTISGASAAVIVEEEEEE